MTTVHIDHLQKRYGDQLAVVDSSLTLESGKFVVFLGPSGCGKTTTLNCIAGFEEATSGRVLFDGKNVTELAPHERNVAMVFQSALLYPHLSARKNIEMSMLHSNIHHAEKADRLEHVVKMLKIGHLLDKKPGQLSGGERQRVALAKATVRQPAVFLMDEPFSALDASLRQSLRSDLVHLQRQLGVTTVFVTHDQVEAMTMGDIIVIMDQGRIMQVGTPSEIYKHPANRFVAGFIGSPPMNFFSGSLQANGSALDMHLAGLTFRLPPHLQDCARQFTTMPAKAYLGVRPEHLSLSSSNAPGLNIPATVYGVERLGKENVIILKADGNTIRVLVSPDTQPALDSQVWLHADLEKAFLFDQ